MAEIMKCQRKAVEARKKREASDKGLRNYFILWCVLLAIYFFGGALHGTEQRMEAAQKGGDLAGRYTQGQTVNPERKSVFGGRYGGNDGIGGVGLRV